MALDAVEVAGRQHVLADLATVHAGGVPGHVLPRRSPPSRPPTRPRADRHARIAALDGAIQLDRWGSRCWPSCPACSTSSSAVPGGVPGGRAVRTWTDFAALGASERPGRAADSIAGLAGRDHAGRPGRRRRTRPAPPGTPNGADRHRLQRDLRAGRHPGRGQCPAAQPLGAALPLAHIAGGHMFTLYLAMDGGWQRGDLRRDRPALVPAITAVRLDGVPRCAWRVWEKSSQAGIGAVAGSRGRRGAQGGRGRGDPNRPRAVSSTQSAEQTPPDLAAWVRRSRGNRRRRPICSPLGWARPSWS